MLILTKSMCKSHLQCLQYKCLSTLHELQQHRKALSAKIGKAVNTFHGHLQYSLSLNFNITLFLLENPFISFLRTGRSTFFLS